MISPLAFIERVMPWPGPEGSGWVNLHWKLTGDDGKPRWRGQPFKEPDALVEQANWLAARPSKAEDIYFCTTVQASCDTHPKGFYIARRKAENATLVKAIWLDVDVKPPPKGYLTLDEAVDAIFQFCEGASLPDPTVLVASGGGVHPYWISERPLTIAEWRPFAEGLRAEAERLGVRCDLGVTTDQARILRMPGTYNRKQDKPRAVRVLGEMGRDYDFPKDLKRLYEIGAPLVTAPVTRHRPAEPLHYDPTVFPPMGAAWAADPKIKAAMETSSNSLSAGIARTDLPLNPTRVFKECKVFNNSIRTGGQKDGQGLWNLVILASTWFKNGRDFAYDLSDKFPGNTPEETDAMFDRKMAEREKEGLGWPSCKAIEREGGKCQGCPFHNTDLGSPLNLAERVKPPVPLGSAAVALSATAAVTAEDLLLPPGYILNGMGQICWCPPPTKKNEDPLPIPIFHGQVIATPRTDNMSNGASATLYFKYKQGTNYKDVQITYEQLGNEHAVTKALSLQTVMINVNALVLPFMRAWVARIDDAFKRHTTQAIGWVNEDGVYNGFAYGGKLYKSDGTEQTCGLPDRAIEPLVTPSGTINPALDCYRMLSKLFDLTKGESLAMEALALTSWASPLVEHASHKAAVAWGWSELSGYGKSTAIFTGASLWCSPGKFKEVPGVTVVALETKMDQVKHLPVLADEVTDEDRLNKISDILQTQPEGTQGGRSNRDGTARYKKYWKNILVCGGNRSLLDYQFKRKIDTDARAQRVLEFKCTYKLEGLGSNYDSGMAISALDNNYGQLGRVYAKYLGTHIPQIRQRIEQVYKELGVKVDIRGRERFWQSLGSLIIVASEIANEILAPFLGDDPVFHTEELWGYIESTIRAQRAWVDAHVEEPTTVLQSLMGRIIDRYAINNLLVTDTCTRSKGDRTPVIWQRLPTENSGRGNPIFMQVVQKPALIRFDMTELKRFVMSEEIGLGAAILTPLMKQYNAIKHRNCNMIANMNISSITKPRVDVMEIEIDEAHALYDVWRDLAYSNKNLNFQKPTATAAVTPGATP